MREDLLMLNFYPELQDTAMASTGEYIFVIDRSGNDDFNSSPANGDFCCLQITFANSLDPDQARLKYFSF